MNSIMYFSEVKVGHTFEQKRYDGSHYTLERISANVFGVNCKQLDNGLLCGCGPDFPVKNK